MTYTDPMAIMLDRMSKRVHPSTIVDVGASDGQWSRMALHFWPKARSLLIEANPIYKSDSEIFCSQSGSITTWAVAGANVGHTHVKFFTDQPCQGITITPTGTQQPVTTIDTEVANNDLPGPYLLKLDVHGHENMILEGARDVLPKTIAVIVEVYLWEPRWGSLLVWEFIPVMLRYGFRPSDLCSPQYRPSDSRCGAFDMLFERSNAPGMEKFW